MLRPLEAGKTGDSGMIEFKTREVTNFGNDASGKDRANARNGSQRIGIVGHLVSNRRIDSSQQLLQNGDMAQTQGQSGVDRTKPLIGQPIGIFGNLLYFSFRYVIGDRSEVFVSQ